MIRLIASDIDGTLVIDGNNYLNPEYFDVILKLKEKGIQFAAASGRQWVGIENLFAPVKEKMFYLSDNGAYIGCYGRNLFLNTIDRQLGMELIRDIRRIPGLTPLLSGPDVLYVDTKDEELVDWLLNGYRFRLERVDDLTQVQDRIIKISAYGREGVKEVTKGLVEQYGGCLQMSLAGQVWLDCMNKGVSKGQAIAVLQENLGILPEETMVFGDQMNDIEMMSHAYYSFAVGNALPEVKRAARFRADTNERDGVLKILRHLL